VRVNDVINERCSLLRGDCLDRLSGVPDSSVDLILTDLPYGTTQNRWDSLIPLVPLWEQYWRIATPNAAVVLFAAQPFGSLLISSQLQQWKQTLIWKKNVASNFLNAKRQHLVIHEEVHVFSAGTPPYFPQMQPGKPYKMKRSGKDDTGDCYGNIKKRTDTLNEGTRYPTTVLEFARETGLHPTQKPVALLEYLIKTYSIEGDVVLDSTMGSGSTGVAALGCGRRFIGIELDEKYFSVAVDRLASQEKIHSTTRIIV